MSRSKRKQRTPAGPAAPSARIVIWIQYVAPIMLIVSAACGFYAWILNRSADCISATTEAISHYNMLSEEIFDRRERFVESVERASTVDDLLSQQSHIDLLHGFRYAQFRDRSLRDLEDEEIHVAYDFGVPSTPALRLQIEFQHREIDIRADDEDPRSQQAHIAVLEALKADNVTALVSDNLPELKRVAVLERGWLYEERVKLLRQGLARPDCGLPSIISRLGDGDASRVHVQFHRIGDP